jgi:transcription-repair coupling factor (superfamily II helicase)
MEDRFDAPPLEAKQLVELMRLETDLRKLRGLGCEAIAKAVSVHFTHDTPLGPAKVVACEMCRILSGLRGGSPE